MKIKRYKRAHKVLEFYATHFGLHRPYQVLLDATFCAHALRFQVHLDEHVPKYLQDESTMLVTTACVVQEAQLLGAPLSGVLHILKQFPLRKCGHTKEARSASQCLYECVRNGNPEHYIVATQDAELSERTRRAVGVPLLYFHMHSITLEKPSLRSQAAHAVEEEKKLALTPHEHDVLKKLSAEILGKAEDDETGRRKTIRKRPRGPNPLSVKKKQTKQTLPGKNTTDSGQPAGSKVITGGENTGQRSRPRRRRHLAVSTAK